MDKADEQELRRYYLFRPCDTKEELQRWLIFYLGLDLPDCIVDEESNSCPLDMVWETYSKMRANNDPDFNRVLYFACRDGFKTLGAAAIEVLAIVHLGRSVAHMAAIKEQAKKAQSYVKKAFRRPYLRDFVVGDNETETKVVRFYNPKTKHSLTQGEFSALSEEAQTQHEEISNTLTQYREREEYVKIIICTLQGANCVDPGMTITMADGSKKLAMDVEIGDSVKVFDTLAREWTTSQISEKGLVVKPAMRISFDGGGSVVVSEDHAVYTNTGWLQARALKLGDMCFDASETGVAPTSHEGMDVAVHGKPSRPESVLVGTLLGDASLTWPKNSAGERYGVGPRLSFSHCDAQQEYLRHKVRLLEKLGLRFSVCKDGESMWKATSNVSADLVPYFELFYGSGRKVVSADTLRLVDDEALAFWLMDDGSGGPEKVGSRKDKHLTLATCCFSGAENELIAQTISERWGVAASVGRTSNGSKIYPIVEIDLDGSRSLTPRLSVYFHHTLKYKLAAPKVALQTRCIDCDAPVPLWKRWKFHRCKKCPHPNGRAERRRQRDFKARFTHRVSKIEWLPASDLLDLHVDTDRPGAHNFVGNSSILLHNSEHVPLMIIDEVDVVSNPAAYAEAQNIPSEVRGKLDLTILTSTRKFAFGLVQDEINRAQETGLHIRHWNLIDITQACPPERHHPEKPRIVIYRSADTLKAIDEATWKGLTPKERESYVRDEGFDGCLNNCRIFAMCKTRLATHQKSKSTFLNKISTVTNKFRKQRSIDMAKAQLLCWKPASTGLIYPRFDRTKHVLSPAQAYFKVFGEEPELGNKLTKAQFLAAVRDRDVQWYGGMDFGLGHNFVYVHGFKDGQRMFVTNCFSSPGLETAQAIEQLEDFKDIDDPCVYPDMADAQAIRAFKRAGWTMRTWNKGKGTIASGITAVQGKLNPVMADNPELFFVHDVDEDPGMALLIQRVQEYHWKPDAAGKPTGVPQDDDDDECFTDDTEALTRHGWVPLSKVTLDDEVIAVTPDGQGVWERPEGLVSKPYKGAGFRVDHHHLGFTATEGHAHAVMTQMDWKVKKRFNLVKRTVEELAGESYWANNLASWIPGPGAFTQGVDEAWMAGFWIAEGCFDVARPTFLIVDQTKAIHQAKVREVAQRLSWTWSETKNGRSIRFVFSRQGPRAAEWRHLFGSGAENKRLPLSLVEKMTAEERRALWEGYMAGDGCRTGSSWHWDTVSARLADDLQILTLALGYGCRIVSYDCMAAGRLMTNPQGRTYSARQSYRGHVLRHGWVTHLKKSRIQKVDLDQMVYCVRVSTGQFLARTAGRVFVAGNCDALRYLVMNVFPMKSGAVTAGVNTVTTAGENEATGLAAANSVQGGPTNWVQQMIARATGQEAPGGPPPHVQAPGAKRVFGERPPMTVTETTGAPASYYGAEDASDGKPGRKRRANKDGTSVSGGKGRRGGLVWNID